jgi:hypothetical protein
MVTRFTKKGLQSRSVTAGLLIKRNQFRELKTKLVIVLAQEGKHIMSSCCGKQRCTFLVERIHAGIGAVKKDVNGYSLTLTMKGCTFMMHLPYARAYNTLFTSTSYLAENLLNQHHFYGASGKSLLPGTLLQHGLGASIATGEQILAHMRKLKVCLEKRISEAQMAQNCTEIPLPQISGNFSAESVNHFLHNLDWRQIYIPACHPIYVEAILQGWLHIYIRHHLKKNQRHRLVLFGL